MTTTDLIAPVSELVHIDPNQVVLAENVRHDVALDKSFVASIKERGVLLPIRAYRDKSGAICVRDGQMRVLGAREAGSATIPVYVFASYADAENVDTVTRISEQIVLNDRRSALTDAERVSAMFQLSLGGLSEAQISKATSTPRKEVKANLAVATSQAASRALQSHQLTLDEALTLAEFEDDEEAVERLTQVAAEEPGQLHHAAQRERDKREEAALIAKEVAAQIAAGIRVLDHGEAGTSVHSLHKSMTVREPIRADEHGECPGHAVRVSKAWHGVTVSAVCTDPEKFGHVVWDARSPMTDEQKQERKTLIANNKAWGSAEVVRREWLAALLSRKSLPTGHAAFTATALTLFAHVTCSNDGQNMAHELMGVPARSFQNNALADLVAKTPTAASRVLLALAIGGFEGNTRKQSWRYPSAAGRYFFTQIEAWGYTLSPVEVIARGEIADAK